MSAMQEAEAIYRQAVKVAKGKPVTSLQMPERLVYRLLNEMTFSGTDSLDGASMVNFRFRSIPVEIVPDGR